MSTSRPFGFYTGTTLPGTQSYGNLIVGVQEDLPYSNGYGGLIWWMGPNEDLGYVIAKTNVTPEGEPLQPTPVEILGTVGFNRTVGKSSSQFLTLAEIITKQEFPTPLDAKIWLESNGYWTSWEPSLWILSTGFWDDLGLWEDTAVWVD
jgi:hypothetical protein